MYVYIDLTDINLYTHMHLQSGILTVTRSLNFPTQRHIGNTATIVTSSQLKRKDLSKNHLIVLFKAQ